MDRHFEFGHGKRLTFPSYSIAVQQYNELQEILRFRISGEAST